MLLMSALRWVPVVLRRSRGRFLSRRRAARLVVRLRSAVLRRRWVVLLCRSYTSMGRVRRLHCLRGMTLSVTVRGGGASASASVDVAPAAVTLFSERGLVKAQDVDGREIGLSRPARPERAVTVYATGCGVTTDLEALAPGAWFTAPSPVPDLDVSRVRLSDGSAVAVPVRGYFVPEIPGVCAYEFTLPSVPTGIAVLEAGLWGVTSTAELPVAAGTSVGGTLRAPTFTMSDGKVRTLDTIVGRITSDAGSWSLTRSPNNHFLVDASGNATIKLSGDGWERFERTLPVGEGVALDLPMIPHLIYPDVKGDYDRETRTWSNAGWTDPHSGLWQGVTNGGDVSLLTMLRALGVNASNPACREGTMTWPIGATIPVYIDPSRQPFYDERGRLLLGATSGPKAGVDAIKEMLRDYADRTGRRIDLRSEPTAPVERITYSTPLNPIAIMYNGVYIQFVPSSELPPGYAAAVAVSPNYAHYAIGTLPCTGITGALISITNTMGYYNDLGNGAGAHEFSTAVGYGVSGRVPFATDNLGYYARPAWSPRDLDGRRMMEHLGPNVDLARYGQ